MWVTHKPQKSQKNLLRFIGKELERRRIVRRDRTGIKEDT